MVIKQISGTLFIRHTLYGILSNKEKAPANAKLRVLSQKSTHVIVNLSLKLLVIDFLIFKIFPNS